MIQHHMTDFSWHSHVTKGCDSKSAVLKNPNVLEICVLFSDSYNYQRDFTSFLKDDLDNLDGYPFQELKINYTTIVLYKLYYFQNIDTIELFCIFFSDFEYCGF